MMNVESRIVSSLEKVFLAPRFEGAAIHHLSALRGERVHFQIAICTGESAGVKIIPVLPEGFAGEITVREVQNIPSLMPCAPEDDWVLRSEPGLYPDALKPLLQELPTAANCWHSAWVTVALPADAPAGDFSLKFKLQFISHATLPSFNPEPEVEKEESLILSVIPACLPEQTLKVTHWFYADCILHHYHVPAWSEEYWALLEKYFRNYAEHRNNLLLTPLWSVPLDRIPGVTERPALQLLQISRKNNDWSFDFSQLERWITAAQKCGIRNFELVHAFSQWGLKWAPEMIVDGSPMFGKDTPFDAPEYTDFLRNLMKEMIPVLQKHGLTPENCYFHISDEPHGDEALHRYRYASSLFREILQGYPYIDALSDIQFFRQGVIDRPIPTIGKLDEFARENTAERWVYFAGSWENGLPGRHFGMPSLRNRILGILQTVDKVPESYIMVLGFFLNRCYIISLC